MDTSNSVEINIGHQTFILKGDDQEGHLREVGEMVRRRIETVYKHHPNISLQKATMLAAFDLASESIKGRQKSQDYRSAILSKAGELLERVQIELSTKSPNP